MSLPKDLSGELLLTLMLIKEHPNCQCEYGLYHVRGRFFNVGTSTSTSAEALYENGFVKLRYDYDRYFTLTPKALSMLEQNRSDIIETLIIQFRDYADVVKRFFK